MLTANRSKTAKCVMALLDVVLVLALAGAGLAADEAKIIPADQARNHIDEMGTFEMIVQLTKDAEPRKVHYLDSEKDYKDEKNLAIIISYDDLEKFKKAGVDSPAVYYKDKTIRVTGKVIRESEQVRIHVTGPEQIKVVKEAKEKP